MNYARRAKYKYDHEKSFESFKTLHGVGKGYMNTLCNKELNEMWVVENNADYKIEDITCKKCIQKIKRDDFFRSLFPKKV